MYYFVGKKELFAVELELNEGKWFDRTALWLNNNRIGNWDDKNLVAPFLRELRSMAVKYDSLWVDELIGLSCYQIFLTIHPFYNNPDDFYSLSEQEMDKFTKFDKFLSFWGENFDAWGLCTVFTSGIYTFLWRHSPKGSNDSFEIRNDIKCYKVSFEEVQKVYNELLKVLPADIWPTD